MMTKRLTVTPLVSLAAAESNHDLVHPDESLEWIFTDA
jgi:hypothetical protein